MVEIIHSPFTPEVLTQDVDYHTESDTVHTQLQYLKRQRHLVILFSDVVFTVFDSNNV